MFLTSPVRTSRITPAWAGKSPGKLCQAGLYEDHPRVGGEKFIIMSSKTDSTGSPPRGRGKVWLFPLLPAVHRITPAWAGKRATPRKNGCPGGDHPRVGGEKLLRLVKKPPLWGSPPRGRGKGLPPEQRIRRPRITPAWAGKSKYNQLTRGHFQDHPRVGGEKAGMKIYRAVA